MASHLSIGASLAQTLSSRKSFLLGNHITAPFLKIECGKRRIEERRIFLNPPRKFTILNFQIASQNLNSFRLLNYIYFFVKRYFYSTQWEFTIVNSLDVESIATLYVSPSEDGFHHSIQVPSRPKEMFVIDSISLIQSPR